MTEKADSKSENHVPDDIITFDVILQEVGEFGRYQILSGILTCLSITLSTCALFNFVFSAAVPDHRCLIPECETTSNQDFLPSWLSYAIPYKDEGPEKCVRFNFTSPNEYGTCSENQFDRSTIISCSKIITKNNEERLASKLNIFCTGEEKRLTYVGTANTFGRLIIMPVVGFVSDKLGRLTTIVGSSVLGAVLGVAQAFTHSYEVYTILEFLVSIANAGILTTSFIYSAEWVTSKSRVISASINGVGNAFGGIIVGVVAFYFENNFQAFKLMMAAPSIICVFYYFILHESPRWLFARHKYHQAIEILKKAAKVNGKVLSDKTIQAVESMSLHDVKATQSDASANTSRETVLLDIFKSKRLVLRLVVLSFVWVFSLFTYYGVILGSTQIYDNKYVSFIIVAAAEIPGAVIAYLILDRFGRRVTVGGTLLTSGLSIITSSVLSKNQWIWRLILFVIGKGALTTTFLALYTYTAELWPTTIRNTTMNICSMLGRTGSILASLLVLLNDDYPYLPSLLCGITASIAAVLVFIFLPETLNRKLPDTIDEAQNIGKESP